LFHRLFQQSTCRSRVPAPGKLLYRFHTLLRSKSIPAEDLLKSNLHKSTAVQGLHCLGMPKGLSDFLSQKTCAIRAEIGKTFIHLICVKPSHFQMSSWSSQLRGSFLVGIQFSNFELSMQ